MKFRTFDVAKCNSFLSFSTCKVLLLFVCGGSFSACVSRGYNQNAQVQNIAVGNNPSQFRANTVCPVKHSSKSRKLDGAERVYKNSSETDFLTPGWESRVASDLHFFSQKNTGEMDGDPNSTPSAYSIVLIDIRTVGGIPHYYYYGNKNWDEPTETWSSSKMVGVGLFLHKLRTLSDGKVGGDAHFSGGSIREDMDRINDESSNEHGSWYKAMTGTDYTNNMIHNWLYRSNDDFSSFHSFNGQGDDNWDSSVTFVAPDGSKSPAISPDWTSRGSNSLSMMTQAEYMKRIGVNFRDEALLPKRGDYNSRRLASSLKSEKTSWTKEDIYTLMFGDYPAGGIGGMMYDGERDVPRNFTIDGEIPDVPDHSGIEKISGGNWTSVGKGGSGESESREKKEEVMMDYFCIPSVNGGEGIEFAIAARMSVPLGGDPLTRIWKTYGRVIDAVYPGIRTGKKLAANEDVTEVFVPENGEAKAKNDTWLKKSPADSASLSAAEKCKIPAGTVLGYTGKVADGAHSQVKLKFEDVSCLGFGTDVYVFTDHFEFTKK